MPLASCLSLDSVSTKADIVATRGEPMITAGIREIKNRLSEYIRKVRAGERVVVTEHGKPVAVITRPGGPID